MKHCCVCKASKRHGEIGAIHKGHGHRWCCDDCADHADQWQIRPLLEVARPAPAGNEEAINFSGNPADVLVDVVQLSDDPETQQRIVHMRATYDEPAARPAPAGTTEADDASL